MSVHKLTDYQFIKLDKMYRSISRLLSEHQQQISKKTIAMNDEMARMLNFKNEKEILDSNQKLEIDWLNRVISVI